MVFEQEIIIKNKLGLHARPAALFVQIANKFDCDISVRKGRQKVNGKSIMGIMMLAAGRGEKIHIKTSGDDAQRAMAELEQLLSGDLDKKE